MDKVPPNLQALLAETIRRQRYLSEGDCFALILHQLPAPDSEERVPCLFVSQSTPTTAPLEAVKGPYQGIKPLLADYDAELDTLEDALESTSDLQLLFDLQQRLIPTARSLRNAVRVLEGAHVAHRKHRGLTATLEYAHELGRDLDILEASLATKIDNQQSRILLQQAQATARLEEKNHRLNMILAMFLPLTALTSAFGMNLDSGLDTTWVPYFWSVWLVGLSLGVVMLYLLNKRI
jgi:Mg2+ and Co2+ transporter CorA